MTKSVFRGDFTSPGAANSWLNAQVVTDEGDIAIAVYRDGTATLIKASYYDTSVFGPVTKTSVSIPDTFFDGHEWDGNNLILKQGIMDLLTIPFTADNVGLGEVDNTSDALKPLSTSAVAALADKVDTVAGMGLSEESFSSAEKEKLAGLESPLAKGYFVDLAAIQAAYPTADIGAYAYVSGDTDVTRYAYEATGWVAKGTVSGSVSGSEIKSLYEAEADTNAFTDAEKAKLGGVAAGAQVNALETINGKAPVSKNINVTKYDIGLSSVDNTPDTEKPVSGPQAAAINAAIAGIDVSGNSPSVVHQFVLTGFRKMQFFLDKEEHMKMKVSGQGDHFFLKCATPGPHHIQAQAYAADMVGIVDAEWAKKKNVPSISGSSWSSEIPFQWGFFNDAEVQKGNFVYINIVDASNPENGWRYWVTIAGLANNRFLITSIYTPAIS